MKHILVGVAALFVSLSTQAAYLYWQVDTSDYSDLANASSVNKYVLYAVQGEDRTAIGTTSTPGQPDYSTVDISTYASGYSFYVELVNWQSADKQDAIARSTSVTYAEFSGHITSDNLSIPNMGPWHASGYAAVPEPSSAVLLMLGMGLLALKRRK